jgi:hypothetical protein
MEVLLILNDKVLQWDSRKTPCKKSASDISIDMKNKLAQKAQDMKLNGFRDKIGTDNFARLQTFIPEKTGQFMVAQDLSTAEQAAKLLNVLDGIKPAPIIRGPKVGVLLAFWVKVFNSCTLDTMPGLEKNVKMLGTALGFEDVVDGTDYVNILDRENLVTGATLNEMIKNTFCVSEDEQVVTIRNLLTKDVSGMPYCTVNDCRQFQQTFGAERFLLLLKRQDLAFISSILRNKERLNDLGVKFEGTRPTIVNDFIVNGVSAAVLANSSLLKVKALEQSVPGIVERMVIDPNISSILERLSNDEALKCLSELEKIVPGATNVLFNRGGRFCNLVVRSYGNYSKRFAVDNSDLFMKFIQNVDYDNANSILSKYNFLTFLNRQIPGLLAELVDRYDADLVAELSSGDHKSISILDQGYLTPVEVLSFMKAGRLGEVLKYARQYPVILPNIRQILTCDEGVYNKWRVVINCVYNNHNRCGQTGDTALLHLVEIFSANPAQISDALARNLNDIFTRLADREDLLKLDIDGLNRLAQEQEANKNARTRRILSELLSD